MYNLYVDKKNLIVICFLQNYKVGHRFTKWPNHITIVPYFYTVNPNNLIENLKSSCKKLGAIKCSVGKTIRVGHNHRVPAGSIKSDKIHQLFTTVSKEAFLHDTTLKQKLTDRDFLPHITHNEIPYPKEGDELEINEIYVVEKLSQNTKEKVVFEKVKLS